MAVQPSIPFHEIVHIRSKRLTTSKVDGELGCISDKSKGTRIFVCHLSVRLAIVLAMPRRAQSSPGGHVYHVLNRANGGDEMIPVPLECPPLRMP